MLTPIHLAGNCAVDDGRHDGRHHAPTCRRIRLPAPTPWERAIRSVPHPRTPLTEGLFAARQFRAMKSTAYLVDITGRSVLFDLDALVRALREGWIAGSDLQIQHCLPPADSPLWELDNLILSNHAANSVATQRRLADHLVENLRRFREGRPLLGLVDKEAGYWMPSSSPSAAPRRSRSRRYAEVDRNSPLC